MIDKFDGRYAFLSNFYPASVTYNGLTYKNSEAAFQAQKYPERSREFTELSASSAKKKGRHVPLRSDWEDVKQGIMKEIVAAKFTQDLALKEKLLATGDEELIEGNTWGDTYWGVCNGIGKNELGKILTQVREELRKDSIFYE